MAVGSYLFGGLSGDLINAASGMTPNEYPFMYFVADDNIFSTDATIGICSVELPFKSGAHLIGIPSHPDAALSLNLNLHDTHPVTLEGNFNDSFSLSVVDNDQSGARYVLDPAAMAFLVDFCSKYYWELESDSLHFLSAGLPPTLETVDEFIRQIQPSVEVPSDRTKNPAKLPYRHVHGRKILCPRCSERLVLGRAWMECPKGHGFMISGKQMLEERRSEESITYAAAQSIIEGARAPIACPYCGTMMDHAPYQLTKNVMVDTCPRCPHRWIDGNEISYILGD